MSHFTLNHESLELLNLYGNSLPGFWGIKDKNHNYLLANNKWKAEVGLNPNFDVFGLVDEELPCVVSRCANKFKDQDEQVMNTKKPLTMTTAYDYWSAKLLNETNIDCILVGDSAAMVMHGYANTIHATSEMMILHTQAVTKGAPDKFIIADLPFLSYRKSISETMQLIDQLMKAGAHAIKLEGAGDHLSTVKYIVDSGIPVMGHIGLTPQACHQLGGNRVQGKDANSASRILQDAIDLQDHGCFSLILECIPQELAELITNKIQIPTIGVGAGVNCDGQALVLHDIFGLLNDFNPKFVKKFCEGHSLFVDAVNQFAREVVNKDFPSKAHSFSAPLMI